jgi:two-component system phosphate regulon sensor histidine kinase PhoR
MVPPQRYFPWKVARQIFFSNLAVVAAVLIMAGFSLRIRVYETFMNGQDIHDSLSRFDSYITSVLFTMFSIAMVLTAVSANWFAQPLGRLIQRARELRRLDRAPEDDTDSDEALERAIDDPGEWSDLERALNRIHKNLRTRTDALSREREELSALIGAVSDAILAIDRNENPLFYNSQYALLFRVAPEGQKALTLGEMFRVPEVLQGYRDVIASGQMKIVAATLHTQHHPLPRHFSISIAPLRVRGGAGVEGAIGVFHDVTELKQAEQIRIEFVGNASHELRTPLTSIKGYVDTLRDDLKNNRLDGAPQFIDIISRNVDRLIFLVNDLLDLSTLESGAELSKAAISTQDITDSAFKQLEEKRALKRQEVRAQISAPQVLADPQRLEQVLVNLVHNAIKYTPEGSYIEVVWEKTHEGIVLRVKDNGPGISLEHQMRLFERFYRVDAGRSRDQGGTGLGLSIVKHIMIKHGGSARVQSKPGGGAEFICIFPS